MQCGDHCNVALYLIHNLTLICTHLWVMDSGPQLFWFGSMKFEDAPAPKTFQIKKKKKHYFYFQSVSQV